ncbi:MAG: ABC transporter substrate-binding protein [Spirochaetaceae bacterium]|nr:MAG: ABC transporter substrate-binding protein [Spirochaetaceae bacterium]
MKKKGLHSRWAIVVLMVALGFAVSSCAQETAESNVIGISKIVSHPALDAVEQGIQDELAALGYEFSYDLQNANGEMTSAASIANKFRSDRVRIAIGIATPTSQALVNSIEDFPVIYSAVTDPVDAGLVDSFDRGRGNVTGVSDLTPVREQIEFLMNVTNIQSLGHVYSSGEANAVRLASLAREAAEDLGIRFVEATVTNSAEVRSAAQSIAGQVDGFYVSTDNTVVSALSALVDVANNAGIPVMSADPSSAEEIGVIAAWGFDYYNMGRATGRLVARVLEGENPEDIPTVFMTDPQDIDLLINKDVAASLGLRFSEEIIAMAGTVVENGVVSRR